MASPDGFIFRVLGTSGTLMKSAGLARSRGKIIYDNRESVRAAKDALPAAFKCWQSPVTGKWRQPKYSPRDVARLKLRFAQKGEPWPYPEVPKKVIIYENQFKGHKRDSLASERRELVRRNMARMDEIVANYREEKKKAKGPRKFGLALLLETARPPRTKKK